MNTEQRLASSSSLSVELLPLRGGDNHDHVGYSPAPSPRDGAQQTERRPGDGTKAENTALLLSQVQSAPRSPNGRIVHSQSGEPRKQLIQNPWKHLALQLAIHILPVASSCVLLWLNFIQHFWFDLQTTVTLQLPTQTTEVSVNTILHVLQIAAKVYEILVLLSMSAIALDAFRAMLVGDGIPFGLITSGYQAGSIGYLTNSGLLSALSTPSAGLACLTIFITLLSVTMGPAAAILLVPTPGWWLAVGQNGARMTSLYNLGNDGDPSQVERWPTKLDFGPQASNEDLAVCLNSYPAIFTYCPAFDIDQISNRAWAAINTSQVSVAVQASLSGVPRWLKSARIANQENQLTVATTLPYLGTEAISAASVYAPLLYPDLPASDFSVIRTAETDPSYQPVVQVKCNLYDWAEARSAANENRSAGLPSWPIDGIDCFDDEICASWQQLADNQRVLGQPFWNTDPNRGKSVAFQWLNESQAPLSAVFKLPQSVNFTQVNTTHTNSSDWAIESGSQWWLGACTLAPRWFPSTSTLALGQSIIIESNATDFGGLNGTILESGASGLPLQVTPAWAGLMDVQMNKTTGINAPWSSDTDQTYSILEGAITGIVTVTSTFSKSGTWETHLTIPPDQLSSTTQAMEAMLGLLVADGISRSTMGNSSALGFLALQRNRDEAVLLQPADQGFDGQYLRGTITPGNSSCPLLVQSQLYNGMTSAECNNITFDEAMQELLSKTRWDFEVEKYGYISGYPSPTLTFSLVMVCLYLASVSVWIIGSIIYHILLAWKRETPSAKMGVTGWGNVQDLVALAWTSRPPDKIQNVGAGVKGFSRIWKQTVMVRVNDQHCLELVEDDSRRTKQAKEGAFYG